MMNLTNTSTWLFCADDEPYNYLNKSNNVSLARHTSDVQTDCNSVWFKVCEVNTPSNIPLPANVANPFSILM